MLLMGKSTISMAMFNSYVKLPEGIFYVAGLPFKKMWMPFLMPFFQRFPNDKIPTMRTTQQSTVDLGLSENGACLKMIAL